MLISISPVLAWLEVVHVECLYGEGGGTSGKSLKQDKVALEIESKAEELTYLEK